MHPAQVRPLGKPMLANMAGSIPVCLLELPAELGSGRQAQLGALLVGDAGIEGKQAGLSGDRGSHRSVALGLVLGIEEAVDTVSHQQAGLGVSVAMGPAGEIEGEPQR